MWGVGCANEKFNILNKKFNKTVDSHKLICYLKFAVQNSENVSAKE